jgi:acetyltransferase-like isoleucine patch superfamily enzyme
MTERVTWIIPILNGMPFLPEMLISIENQTYTNWEVLIWDNGSTDGTLEELEKWIPSRLPGRIVKDSPLSLGESLAKLVELSNTDLCARIDADDINFLDRLEEQVKFLSTHPEISVVGGQMNLIDDKGILFGKLIVPYHHDDIVHKMLVENSISHPSVLFRRSKILQIGNYRHLDSWKGVNIEDYDLWLRVATFSRLANLDKTLVNYRVHDRSTTQVSIRENRLRDAVNNCVSENSYNLFGCTPEEISLLRQKQHFLAVQSLYKLAKHLHKNQGGEILKRLRSESFIHVARSCISSKDIISRIVIASLERQALSLPKEILNIIKYSLLKLPGFQSICNLLYRSKVEVEWRINTKKWFIKNKKIETFVHPSIYFVGVAKPNLENFTVEAECYIDKNFSIWISNDKGADPRLVIKYKAYIARDVFIGVFQPVNIGQFTQIGAYSYILSGDHQYQRRDIPIREQGYKGAPVFIKDHVWIGTHVVILPGVTIGEGAIIAAHSLVNRDIPAYEVWGGIPAKFIKVRPNELN